MGRAQWVRILSGLAIAGGLAWLVGGLAIVLQGGVETAVDTVAFFAGLVLVVLGAASVGLRLTAGRSALATGLAVAGSVVLAFLLVPGLSIVSSSLWGDDTLVGREGGVTLLAVVAIVVGVTGLRARRSIGASTTV